MLTVLRLLDLTSLLCREEGSGQSVVLSIGSLERPRVVGGPITAAKMDIDLQSVTAEQWLVAEAHRAAISPLLANLPHGSKKFSYLAQEHGVSLATLYRWASIYRESGGLLSSLLETVRDGHAGEGRLHDDVESIITDYIDNEYGTLQKLSKAKAVTDIRSRCSTAKLPLPAANTIRLRIAWRDRRTMVEGRLGRAEAVDTIDPTYGSIPDANWPLALVQMDHTLLPVIIVLSSTQS